MTDDERKALQASIAATEASLADGERWKYVCRLCGKTPQDIGWCDQCGYNRQYERSLSVTIQ